MNEDGSYSGPRRPVHSILPGGVNGQPSAPVARDPGEAPAVGSVRRGLSHALVRAACALLTAAAALLDPALDDAFDRETSRALDRILVLREICRC